MIFIGILQKAWPLALLFLIAGCAAPQRLMFPAAPLKRMHGGIHYDISGNGIADFALLPGADSRPDVLAYDADEDGRYERIYRLSDYVPQTVPHLVILLDSIPYQCLLDFYRSGHFSWFPAPQKVIPPFPTLTAVIFNRIVHAPPRPETNNNFYDHRSNGMQRRFWKQLTGQRDCWQRRLHYTADYLTEGWGFVKPRKSYRKELAAVKKTLDQSPDQVTVAYLVSSAGLVCKYGWQGARECLAELERLCLQILWERRGAVKISITADHGHNFTRSTFI